METPTDIIARHLDLAVNSGDGAPDPDTLAAIIAEELKQNFRIVSHAAPDFKDGEIEFCVRLTGNPMVFYYGTDKQAYRLDDGFPPGSRGFPSGREAQIALALADVSASRLHEVTK